LSEDTVLTVRCSREYTAQGIGSGGQSTSIVIPKELGIRPGDRCRWTFLPSGSATLTKTRGPARAPAARKAARRVRR
jgi:hypothetical protein